ncbi:hypothetical protein N7528_002682 [Penicillium herquei]|nr:hypothetical protein N7528_002682 [Penicillium herquei]
MKALWRHRARVSVPYLRAAPGIYGDDRGYQSYLYYWYDGYRWPLFKATLHTCLLQSQDRKHQRLDLKQAREVATVSGRHREPFYGPWQNTPGKKYEVHSKLMRYIVTHRVLQTPMLLGLEEIPKSRVAALIMLFILHALDRDRYIPDVYLIWMVKTYTAKKDMKKEKARDVYTAASDIHEKNKILYEKRDMKRDPKLNRHHVWICVLLSLE